MWTGAIGVIGKDNTVSGTEATLGIDTSLLLPQFATTARLQKQGSESFMHDCTFGCHNITNRINRP